jgi:hypothetical protein
MIRSLLNPYWWAVALPSLVQLALSLRWLYRRLRNDEIMRAFVQDIATNHLPHSYERLERLRRAGNRALAPPAYSLD